MATAKLFYILCNDGLYGEHALWWRPDSAGYTTDLDRAGLYESCPSSRDIDVMVPQEVAERLAVRVVPLDALRGELEQTAKRRLT